MMDHSLMQTSRSSPNPTPSLLEDSWYTSRLPVSGAVSSDQMIAEIKMRNRRYQQSVAGTEQTRPMMMMQPQQMMTEEMMMMTNLAYTDLQRQVHMLQTPPTAPLQAPRRTHLLTINREMGVEANGVNYWYYNSMLGPCRI